MADVVRVDKADNRFQHLEVLKRNRAKRTAFREIFVEGVRAINLAREQNWTIKQVVFSSGKPLSTWASEYIESPLVGEAIALAPHLMDELSDRDEPSELIAVVKKKTHHLASLSDSGNPLWIVMDRPSNPGNLGSTIRSCDAFGASALLISGHGADPYDPRAIRSSLGTVFCIPVHEVESNEALLGWITRQREAHPALRVVGTSAKSTTLVSSYDLSGPAIMFLGNETYGLGRKLQEMVDDMVTIPMKGNASSLNVAAAATVALYECARQRLEKNGGTP